MSCLVVLAAGLGSRFGGTKQLAVFGPLQRTLMEYNICHAYDAGFRKVVLVIQSQIRAVIEKQIIPRLPKGLEICIAEQNNTNLPKKCIISSSFVKPLGTAHALWCAKQYIDSDFSVINGDDYYASDAFRLLADESPPNQAKNMLVAYRLAKTLSKNGGVNRGICKIGCSQQSESEVLISIEECLDIKSNGAKISGQFESRRNNSHPSKQINLDSDDLVSMNCWRFKKCIITRIENALIEHFNNLEQLSECYLPSVIMQTISENNDEYPVKQTEQSWFGLTYANDCTQVEQKIAQLSVGGAFKTLEKCFA